MGATEDEGMRAALRIGEVRVGAVAVMTAVMMAALVIAAGVAYACTSRASLQDVQPSSARAGAQVTVSGSSWHDGDVELTWNTQGGPHLGTADGPGFSEPVRIPEDADAGPHYIVATAYADDGTVEGRDSVAFEVTSGENPYEDGSSGEESPESSGDPDGESSNDSDGGEQGSSSPSTVSTSGSGGSEETSEPTEPAGQPSSQDETSQQPSSQESTAQEPASQDATSPEQSGQQSGAHEPGAQDESAGEPEPAPATDDADASEAGPPAPAPEPVAAGDEQGAAAPGAGRDSADEPAAAPDDSAAEESIAPASAEAAADRAPAAEVPASRLPQTAQSDGEAPAASGRTGSGDLWDGLDAGDEGAPALDGPAGDSGELAGAGQHLTVAAGLVGAGLVLLMGGVLVAAIRRRPATANATQP